MPCQVLDIAAKKESVGKEHVQDLIESGEYGYSDMIEHESILTHHVRESIKSGDAKGYPFIKDGETVPTQDDLYKCTGAQKLKCHSTRAHKDVPFLRSAGVTAAVRKMQNMGKYPVRCTPDSMPVGVAWDNYAEVLYTFHSVYCLSLIHI